MPGKNTNLSHCRLLSLSKHTLPNGSITVVEHGIDIPFDVKRVFYLYDVPGGESRGGHAHHTLHQLIVAGSGSFDVVVDDGSQRNTYSLNRPYQGLWVPPGIWSELTNFSSGAVTLVLTSAYFAEEDYIRDYPRFVAFKGKET